MGKIFYLMGKSSSGKDSIYKRLLADEELALKTIVLYTTRPIRVGEREGVEYHFVSKQALKELLDDGRVIEHRAYNTCLGVWDYFTVDDESVDLDKSSYLLIGTIESFIKMREYFGAENVIPLMIELDDGERLARALKRERSQKEPKYAELCRRFLADEADFSAEKKAEAGIEKEFINDDLDRCAGEAAAYIRFFL